MSEYTPTTDEVLRCYQMPMTAEQGQRDGESFAEFLSRRSIETFQQQIADREAAASWLAEVTRAAEGKALTEIRVIIAAQGWQPLWFFDKAVEAYRRNEGSRNAESS